MTGLEQELGRVGGGGEDHEAGARELRETEEAPAGEQQEWCPEPPVEEIYLTIFKPVCFLVAIRNLKCINQYFLRTMQHKIRPRKRQ